jgi:hypothetical protein
MAEQAVLEDEATEQTTEQAEEQQQEQQPEAQEPQAEEPAEPGSIHDDPLLSSLYEDLGLISKPVKEEEVEIEQVEEPPPEEPEPEPEPEEQEPELEPEEKPKLPKTFEVKTPVTPTDVRDAVREEFERYKLPEAKPEEAKAEEPEDTYEASLLEEQREELSLARYAESKMPDKYKGMGNKLLDFYKKLDNYATKAQEDPDRTLDSNDEEFLDFIKKNKPALTQSESKKLERMMWKEEAVAEARQATEEDKRQMEQKLHNLEAKPRIENSIREFESNIPKMIPDELGDLIREKGMDKVEEDNPYEVSIIKDKLGSATSLAREYLNISNGITPFNSSNNNHSWLLGFVNNQAEYFSKNGGNELVRQDSYGNTAQFVTPTEYAGLVKDGKSNGKWTFTPDDVLKMLGANAVKEAQDTIKSEEERLTKMGFVRQKKTSAAEPKKKGRATQETKPITPPKSKSSAGPGAVDNAAIEDPPTVGSDIIDILKMKD